MKTFENVRMFDPEILNVKKLLTVKDAATMHDFPRKVLTIKVKRNEMKQA